MAENEEVPDNRRLEESPAGPPVARVRDEDLEPHDGLRYIAKLFKALALLLVFMMIADLVIGLQQDGLPVLANLLVEATRLIVFAGFIWAAGDLAVLLIESNHDLRASRILLGRLNGKLDRMTGGTGGPDGPADRVPFTAPPTPLETGPRRSPPPPHDRI
jgi:hypothetical protein